MDGDTRQGRVFRDEQGKGPIGEEGVEGEHGRDVDEDLAAPTQWDGGRCGCP